jgi:hypothetical protein
MEHSPSEKARLGALRAEREYVIELITKSEQTIERSRELIKRIDELLAKGWQVVAKNKNPG